MSVKGEELVDVTLQAGVLCLYIRKISEISASHLSHAADGPLSLTVGAPGGEWWQEPYRSEVTFEFISVSVCVPVCMLVCT